MFYLILSLIFLLNAIIIISIGFLINYHFKKLGVDEDKGPEKIMKIYKTGSIIIFFIGIVSLILLNFI